MKTSWFTAALLLGASLVYGQSTPAPPASTIPVPAVPTPTPASPGSDKAKMKREKMFSRLDANNDGFLDGAEFKKARFAQKDASRAEKRFDRSDKNNDDKISKEEWLTSARHKGKGKGKGSGKVKGKTTAA